MKRFTKSICIIVAMVILLAVPVAAEENDNATTWSRYYVSWSAYLYKESSTQFDICFDVLAKGEMRYLGVSEVEVQRSSNGTTWTTIDTLTSDDYSEFMAENTSMHMDYILYTAAPGYYYRAYVTFYAENNSGGIGIMYEYTDVVKLP